MERNQHLERRNVLKIYFYFQYGKVTWTFLLWAPIGSINPNQNVLFKRSWSKRGFLALCSVEWLNFRRLEFASIQRSQLRSESVKTCQNAGIVAGNLEKIYGQIRKLNQSDLWSLWDTKFISPQMGSRVSRVELQSTSGSQKVPVNVSADAMQHNDSQFCR